MIKNLIERIFRIKIMRKDNYERMIAAISDVGILYRRHSPDYHNHDTLARIELRKLSAICIAENQVWEDVEPILCEWRKGGEEG